MTYPDTASARITVEELDASNTAQTLLTSDIILPPRQIIALQVQSISPNLSDPLNPLATLQMVTQLPASGITGLPLQDSDPTPLLILAGQSSSGTPITEQYVRRPTSTTNYQQSYTVTVVVSITPSSRIYTNQNAFVGQTAYLVLGFITPVLTLSLPTFQVPIDQQTARGRVCVDMSTQNPFTAANSKSSRRVLFMGQQWLSPPVPIVPAAPIPTHIVHHDYYDPADFYGQATRQLPFTATPNVAGTSGYVLQRAPIQVLFQADIKRRQANNGPGLIDMNFSIQEADGTTRGDLQLWDALLTTWRDAYNLRVFGQNTSQWLDNTTILSDSDARRAFTDHFYGGLLDDELRVLADIAQNATGFVRINSTPIQPGTAALSDTVDGAGFGRFVYKFVSVNASGSIGPSSHALGPYYTRIITPPRPPILHKITPQNGNLALQWALDNSPDNGAYLLCRTSDPLQLNADGTQFADLRYFGPDLTYPLAASALAPLVYRPQQWPPLVLDNSDPTKALDPRLVALVPDRRLFARDYSDGDYNGTHYNGSDMGEVVLPARIIPEQINAIYRLSDYNPKLAPDPASQAQAFNYWQPAQGGTSQLVQDSATQARIIGLRIGLGRGVPVVVVATVNNAIQVLGTLPTLSPTMQTPVRRYTFVDDSAGSANDGIQRFTSTPLAPGTLYYYSLVAVDIFGNRSAPARVFGAQTLGLATAQV